ncbi:hypothetical protein ACJVC5_04965 [Peredibacter sp. HCB2-198]|uniref:hypothetical protein n=1 Tax=Peredibacter sp. HCB2-198 TaxID=3383025 RepID=UPI0038B6015A
MKANILFPALLLTMSLTSVAQVCDEDLTSDANEKICHSSDPLISANVECYPENNLMIIRNPEYKFAGQKLNLVYYNDTNSIWDAREVCKIYGADSFTEKPKVKTKFIDERGVHVLYSGLQRIKILERSKGKVITEIHCEIKDVRPRAMPVGDGSVGCYSLRYDGSRGEKLLDFECDYGTVKSKSATGETLCFKADMKKVPYGDSIDPEFCAEKKPEDRFDPVEGW